jgi:hypothetical protein
MGFCELEAGGLGVGAGAVVCGLCAVASNEKDKRKPTKALRNEFI